MEQLKNLSQLFKVMSILPNQPENTLVIYTSNLKQGHPKEKFEKLAEIALLESVIREGINEGLMSLDQPLISAYSIWAQLHGIIDVS